MSYVTSQLQYRQKSRTGLAVALVIAALIAAVGVGAVWLSASLSGAFSLALHP